MQEVLSYSRSHPFSKIPIPLSATRYREASDCIRLKDGEKRLQAFQDTPEIRRSEKGFRAME